MSWMSPRERSRCLIFSREFISDGDLCRGRLAYPDQRIFQELSVEIKRIGRYARKCGPVLVLLWVIGVAFAIKDYVENHIPRNVIESRFIEMHQDAGDLRRMV